MQQWLNNRHHLPTGGVIFHDHKPGNMKCKLINRRSSFYFILLSIVALSILLIIINILQINNINEIPKTVTIEDNANSVPQPLVWIRAETIEIGYLSHVISVFEQLGYQLGSQKSWDVLWSHEYPFKVLKDHLQHLLPHQKVNHIPGTGYITNKAFLATLKSQYILPAFRLPSEKERLLQYARRYPEKLFVEKNNLHRGIKVKKISEMDLNFNGIFVQEFLDRPFLINQRKFDVGIYTIITSVNPLRLYIYNTDILLRFCKENYYPFDEKNLNKYVVDDDYTPVWEIPDLLPYFKRGFTAKDTLNAYLRNQGKNPAHLWSKIKESIQDIYLKQQPLLIKEIAKFQSSRNFFEMVRFDFVFDEDLNIYILEANMSPNLSSSHFPANQLLYEQVLFNLFSLLGFTNILKYKLQSRSDISNIQVSNKDLSINLEVCAGNLCQNRCSKEECAFCLQCLSDEQKLILKDAYREHMSKWNCRRIFPPSWIQENIKNISLEGLQNYTPENRFIVGWFQGKCLEDKFWCF